MKFRDIKTLWKIKFANYLGLNPENKEELVGLLRKLQEIKILNPEILTVLERAISFDSLQVRDIMLPKKQIVCVAKNTELPEVLKIVTVSGHSRFPVTDNNGADVLGILHAKDLLRFQIESASEINLTDIIRRAPIIPESMRLDSLLNEFKTNRNHMAIVVDEYGEVSGFVTIEDLIEQIIGDIADEFDIDEEAYIKAHSDKNFVIKAHMPIEEFNEQMQSNFLDKTYDTIGGVIVAKFGHLPKASETITIDGFEFIIKSADARCIHLIECFDRRTKDENLESSS